MIRTIAVQAGNGQYTSWAQEHTLALAKLFGARLRVVGVADLRSSNSPEGASEEEAPEPVDLVQRIAGEFADRVRDADIPVEVRFHGEGIAEGLLAEAAASGLLVVAVPPEKETVAAPEAAELLRNRLPLLRKAECSLLGVFGAPAAFGRLLVCYGGGIEGKAALRVGAELAERAGAEVDLLALGDQPRERVEHAATAEQYLAAFDIPDVATTDTRSHGGEASDILHCVLQTKATLIVLGCEPYGMLERFFGGVSAEVVTLETTTPVLVAR